MVCASPCRQQLWRELLDTMAGEAMWLREVMGLPERDTWIYEKEEPPIPDAGETQTFNKM